MNTLAFPVNILIFAKAPIAGHAKTRLIPAIGESAAARIHRRLVAHTLRVARAVPGAGLFLYYSEPHPFFIRMLRKYRVVLCQQAGGDLGDRMTQALAQHRGYNLLVGSDCPSITTAMLDSCARSLRHHQAVFLPAEDGGFGLVGTHQRDAHALSRVFHEIPWGSAEVMRRTRSGLRERNWSWDEPFTVWDVDLPEDLVRLAAGGGSGASPGKKTR